MKKIGVKKIGINKLAINRKIGPGGGDPAGSCGEFGGPNCICEQCVCTTEGFCGGTVCYGDALCADRCYGHAPASKLGAAVNPAHRMNIVKARKVR